MPGFSPLVLATANAGKLRELQLAFAQAGLPIEVVARPDDAPDVVEDAPDLLGNARLKAAALVAHTGHAALADDTGLEVEALDGGPGVHTARFAGSDATDCTNIDKLLAELAARPERPRTATFRTVIVVHRPDGPELVAEGHVEGVIAPGRTGDGGWGYDPVFIPSEGDGRSFAQMTKEEKNALSHRGRAVRAAIEQVQTELGG